MKVGALLRWQARQAMVQGILTKIPVLMITGRVP